MDSQNLTHETATEKATPAIGTLVTGTIDNIVGSLVFVSLNGHGGARIDMSEFSAGDAPAKVGNSIEAKVLSVQNGVELTRKYVDEAAALAALEAAVSAQTAVQGLITGISSRGRGGYDVRVSNLRAYCPVSEFDARQERTQRRAVGQSYEFLVKEVSRGNDGSPRVTLSRLALVEEERRRAGAALTSRFEVGAVISGKISQIKDFGVFVKIDDKIEGLIPMGELSHKRVEKAGDVVKIGQSVEVKVLSVDGERNRLSLSLRAMTPDPWDVYVAANPAGTTVKGTVARLIEAGAVVHLADDVEGFLHVGSISAARIKHASEKLAEGQELELIVEQVVPGERAERGERGPDRRRIRLMTAEVAETRKPLDFELNEGAVITVKVTEIVEQGVGVFVGGQYSGFIPAGETNTPRGSKLGDSFKVDQEVEAKILSVDAKRSRVRLSIKALTTHADEVAFKSYKAEERASGAEFSRRGSFSAFASLLK